MRINKKIILTCCILGIASFMAKAEIYTHFNFEPVEYVLNKKEKKSFTLRNNSLKSIPLIIPGVMNPNLSPMSNSGVTLRIGQNIYFKVKRKKYLLLTVDEQIENGSTIIVNQLIKARKKELGL